MKRNILIVALHYPIPAQTGSALALYNQTLELARKHAVRVICCDVEAAREVDDRFPPIELVARRARSRLRRLAEAVIGFPLFVSAWRSEEMYERMQDILSGPCRFDAIVLYEVPSAQYCPMAFRSRAILNVEDPQSIRLLRMSRLPITSLVQRLRYLFAATVARRYEIATLPSFGKVLTFSEADARDMRDDLGLQNSACVPYGVQVPPDGDIPIWEKRIDGMIVLSGNMYHPPNVDGAMHFLKEIFPRVISELPFAKLWIVGEKPDHRIAAAAERYGSSVVVTGRVDCVSSYIRKARVSICPVRLKIGVQTKVLEAMSWGTPVVSTSAGNSGVGGISGAQLLVADEAGEFAKCVVRLLRGEGWEKISSGGRRFVAENFSWRHSAAVLDRYIEEISVGA